MSWTVNKTCDAPILPSWLTGQCKISWPTQHQLMKTLCICWWKLYRVTVWAWPDGTGLSCLFDSFCQQIERKSEGGIGYQMNILGWNVLCLCIMVFCFLFLILEQIRKLFSRTLKKDNNCFLVVWFLWVFSSWIIFKWQFLLIHIVLTFALAWSVTKDDSDLMK